MAEREMRQHGLTAGSGMLLGIVFGAVFGHLPLWMIFGMLVGAAVAGARRRADQRPTGPNLGLTPTDQSS